MPPPKRHWLVKNIKLEKLITQNTFTFNLCVLDLRSNYNSEDVRTYSWHLRNDRKSSRVFGRLRDSRDV